VIVVVMGVASAGKTTVGEGLAQALAWPFRDADSFHPASNVAKMSAGLPLTDADRWPWLDAIVSWMDARAAAGEHGVVTCSALKRAYRDRLRTSHAAVRFVHLHGSRDLLAARIAARADHFMPASLLDSQLATLEPPAAEEAALDIDISRDPGDIVRELAAILRQ
jgi:carbohydrate kinase (thermoresistant glucokinase family)